MNFLTLTNISKIFGSSVAVEDFNLDIEKGELVSFLGPSGCGKTTTLRMIAGFELPTTGTIHINGQDVTTRPTAQRNVGMVFQSYALFPNMTIGKNISFGLEVAKRSRAEIKERVTEMLDLIHMSNLGNRYPYQLSGGQQQRVALARALAAHPQVLLLDEPLSALDAKIRVSLRTEIRAIQKKLGITAIYVTHDQEEALSISDRVVVMNSGRIEQAGKPLEIYNKPETAFVAQFVGTLSAIPSVVVDAKAGKLSVEGQEIQIASALEGYSKGDQITIALRPELLSIKTGSEDGNTLRCTIENITFLGSIVRFSLRLGTKLIDMDSFNNPHLTIPQIGDHIELNCGRDSVLVLHSTQQVLAGDASA
jgi:putative spermidine/putrescine transport system ATP-binding protein